MTGVLAFLIDRVHPAVVVGACLLIAVTSAAAAGSLSVFRTKDSRYKDAGFLGAFATAALIEGLVVFSAWLIADRQVDWFVVLAPLVAAGGAAASVLMYGLASWVLAYTKPKDPASESQTATGAQATATTSVTEVWSDGSQGGDWNRRVFMHGAMGAAFAVVLLSIKWSF